MPSENTRLLQLFFETLRLSACTFGGGFVIVPLMRKRFVEQLHWISEREMLDMTAIAQSTPGAIAVNAAILVGYRLARFRGALAAMLGTILPPLAIISVISFFYTAFRDNIYVSMAMAGMLAGVAAVLCDVVISMVRGIVKQKRILPIVLLTGSFVAVQYLHVSIILVMLFCGAAGAVDTLRRERSGKERPS